MRIHTLVLTLAIPLCAALPGLTLAAESPASGSETFDIYTSSAPTILKVAPGGTVSTILKVKNGSPTPQKLKVGVMKFSASGEEGKPILQDPEPGDEYLKWVRFSENEITVSYNEWKSVTATFTPPKEAAFGYYYAATFSRADLTNNTQHQTQINGAVTNLILLEVESSNAKKQAEILEFTTSQKIYSFLPASFKVKVRNTGNVHVSPVGNIFIRQGNEPELATIKINSERGNILPESNRVFETTWKEGFPVYQPKVSDNRTVLDEKGMAVKELHWNIADISKMRFGRYTANLVLIYDNGTNDVPLEAATTFWVLPWQIVLAGIIGALLVLLGLFSLFKRIKSISAKVGSSFSKR